MKIIAKDTTSGKTIETRALGVIRAARPGKERTDGWCLFATERELLAEKGSYHLPCEKSVDEKSADAPSISNEDQVQIVVEP